MSETQRIGLIAGNGRFPLLVLEQALKKDLFVVVAAIKEETWPEIEQACREAGPDRALLHWLGLGQLGRLIRLFKKAKVEQAVMAGQVKHVQIFAPNSAEGRRRLAALPDLKMLRLLASLPQKNTVSLIGAVAGVLEEEGIRLLDSTFLLRDLLPTPGCLTRRNPTRAESRDIRYGLAIARELARLDVGQTVVVRDRAAVAVEAMEGTDQAIRRASRLAEGAALTVVKVSRPDQDMRFDVPVIGLQTLEVLEQCNVTALAIEAGRTLLLDRRELLRQADRLKLAMVAVE